jgi:hypothetical protein
MNQLTRSFAIRYLDKESQEGFSHCERIEEVEPLQHVAFAQWLLPAPRHAHAYLVRCSSFFFIFFFFSPSTARAGSNISALEL